MQPAHLLQIQTPKGVLLNGLWRGPVRASTVYILVHGLTGSMFGMHRLASALVGKEAAVLAFNNRGFEQVATVKRKKGREAEYITVGMAHEIFTDCVDDVQGAVNAAKRAGAKRIVLVGHSTGAQKVLYWAAKGGRGAHSIVLLGPLSDYADALVRKNKKRIAADLKIARQYIKERKPHRLLPQEYTDWFVCDAQRFVSLYTPESEEEIFTYASGKKPMTLGSVRLPIAVFLAGADEYGDRPAKKIGDWFAEHLKVGDLVSVIPRVGHSFKGAEKRIAKELSAFGGKH